MKRERCGKNEWAAGIAALCLCAALSAGCFTDADSEDGAQAGSAVVTIRLGGGAGSAGSGDLAPLAGLPEGVTFIEVTVSAEDMEDVFERVPAPEPGEAVTIELTLPAGADRYFYVDALGNYEVDVRSSSKETFEFPFYHGETTADLAPGPNDVDISMDPRSLLAGQVWFLETMEPFDPGGLLTNFKEEEGSLPIETDEDGLYLLPLPPGAYRAEVHPGARCPNVEGWEDCLAFGEARLAQAGEVVRLDLFLIPQAEAFPYLHFATSVAPGVATPGGLLTLFGTNFPSPEESPPTVFFYPSPQADPIPVEAQDWDEDFAAVRVPAGISGSVQVSLFAVNIDIPESNRLPLVIQEVASR